MIRTDRIDPHDPSACADAGPSQAHTRTRAGSRSFCATHRAVTITQVSESRHVRPIGERLDPVHRHRYPAPRSKCRFFDDCAAPGESDHSHHAARGLQRAGPVGVRRQHEPRDSNADERDYRHGRACDAHEHHADATRIPGQDPGIGQIAATHHQRHPRLLEGRRRKTHAQEHPVRTGRRSAEGGSDRRSNGRNEAAGIDRRSGHGRAEPSDRRSGQARASAGQPGVQRRQVHTRGPGLDSSPPG